MIADKSYNGGCSSVGRAPDCGSGCRGFDPHHSPQQHSAGIKDKKLAENIKKIYITSTFFTCRGVAQLVAHSLWERGVVSSSLATPTIFLHKRMMS